MTRFYYITALALVFSFGGEVQAISFPNDARYSAKPRIERIDLSKGWRTKLGEQRAVKGYLQRMLIGRYNYVVETHM